MSANRVLRTVNLCNEAMIRAVDERTLIKDILRIVLKEGGYVMAWVGYAQHDKARSVLPVGHAGFERGYLEKASIRWAATRRGRGPTGMAIRKGQTQFCRNFLTDPRLAPWREQALKRGFRSSIALPLAGARGVFGALTIYAARPDAFSEEAAILERLAGNLAFGIESLRTREALGASRERLRALAADLIAAEQRERSRVAEVLHDELQQLLAAAGWRLDRLEVAGGTASKAATEARGFIKEAMDCSRSLTKELSPPVLTGGGLAGALQWLGATMKKKHGLSVAVDAEAAASPRGEAATCLLYRSVREILFNVVKHAGVRFARVHARRVGDQVRLTVSDKGAGFDPDAANRKRGFGLASIRDRLDLLGGGMTINSAPGAGSRFTLWVPV